LSLICVHLRKSAAKKDFLIHSDPSNQIRFALHESILCRAFFLQIDFFIVKLLVQKFCKGEEMDIFWEELTAGIPETRQFIQVVIRLFAAVLLGAIIGLQRERVGKPAGFRTHILVMLGTTVFTLSGSIYGMTTEGISRVLQGIITGIGFIGAGSILKQRDELKIRGLTTAAGIWMTTAVGAAVGLGFLGLAIIATALLLLILKLSDPLENDSKKYGQNSANEEQKQ